MKDDSTVKDTNIFVMYSKTGHQLYLKTYEQPKRKS